MRNLIISTMLLLLVSATCMAQGDVVFEASRLEWDYSPEEIAALVSTGGEFRMYCQADTPGVVPDLAILVGQIAPDTLEWIISMTRGHYYCIVTASNATGESSPSNEWEGTVLGNPNNLRLEVTEEE